MTTTRLVTTALAAAPPGGTAALGAAGPTAPADLPSSDDPADGSDTAPTEIVLDSETENRRGVRLE
jgi:hypothetical protein